ncbi:MAG: 30S ribosomal protein S2 [Patescibacteria group bacterium]
MIGRLPDFFLDQEQVIRYNGAKRLLVYIYDFPMQISFTMQDLLSAGAHFGHIRQKYNPKMKPFVYAVREGVHLIDLEKTVVQLSGALDYLAALKAEGKKVLFVCTKPHTNDIVKEAAIATGMPFICYRWPGGMLTNFNTLKKQLEKLTKLEALVGTPAWDTMSKKDKSRASMQIAKLSQSFEGIKNMHGLPDALFIVDTIKEKTAVAEARTLKIPMVALLDTNSNPEGIAYPVPMNDDAKSAVELVMGEIKKALK